MKLITLMLNKLLCKKLLLKDNNLNNMHDNILVPWLLCRIHSALNKDLRLAA